MSKLEEFKKRKSRNNGSDLKNKIFLFGGLFLIILLVAGAVAIFLPKPISNTQAAALAKCMTNKGIKMYGAYWCHVCKNQKELFGDAFQFVDYVECQLAEDKANPDCISAGIEKFPTWIIEGKKHTGLRQLQELAELSGCELKEN